MSRLRMPRRAFLTSAAALAAGAVGGRLYADPARVEVGSTVESALGRVRGLNDRGVHVFKGIPYGAPPVQARRFMAPAPVEGWAGVYDAFEYGSTAPQRPQGFGPLYRSEVPVPERGEDCLRLNVWTPSLSPGRRPVLLWWHGGGFEAGSGSSVRYDGVNLCLRGDVVVVTVNHRLNVFGHCYLAHRLGDEFAQSGNVGFLDLVASLRWVHDNIDRFGGDPNNVMIFGQSGGGRKVSLALASPAAKGLFHRAVVHSGSHLRVRETDAAADLTDRLLHDLGIRPGQERALQTLPWQQIMSAQLKLIGEVNQRFAPVIDDTVFDGHPWDPEAPSVSAHVPMMVGTTRTELTSQRGNEDSIYTLDEAQLLERLEHYLPSNDIEPVVSVFKAENPWASPSQLFFLITSARGYGRDATLQLERRVRSEAAPAYRYCLMWRTPVEGGRRMSPHSLDVPLVFDNVRKSASMVGPPTDRALQMASVMAETWIAFARTGDPNNAAIPAWRPYDLEHRTAMLFDDRSMAVDDPHRAERLIMERFPSQQEFGRRALHRTES